MISTQIIPTKAGQICKIREPVADENPEDVYILTEDPSEFEDTDTIYVVNLKDLQRNIKQPDATTPVAITKEELTVVAGSLEDYISSWNS